jgi:hypothetical protein
MLLPIDRPFLKLDIFESIPARQSQMNKSIKASVTRDVTPTVQPRTKRQKMLLSIHSIVGRPSSCQDTHLDGIDTPQAFGMHPGLLSCWANFFRPDLSSVLLVPLVDFCRKGTSLQSFQSLPPPGIEILKQT